MEQGAERVSGRMRKWNRERRMENVDSMKRCDKDRSVSENKFKLENERGNRFHS